MHSLATRLIQYGLIVLFAASSVHADEKVVLGEAVVPDRSDSARSAALPTALANALRRLTPADNPTAKIDTAAVLAENETLLQRFDYAQVTRPTTSGIPSIKLMLRARFHAAPVRELLVRAGLPVWRGGEVAPTFWLIDESDDGRRLLEKRGESALQGFDEALAARGVRMLWSMNDLSDWQMVESLTRDDAPRALAEAAERSGADPAVLTLIRQSEEGTDIDWFMRAGEVDHRFSSSGADRDTALSAAVSRLIDVLAQSHAVRPDTVGSEVSAVDRGPGEYVIWLENLTRAGVYAEAVGLLQGQSIVASLTPEQATADRVRLRVRITAPLTQLLALLAADGRLILSSAPVDGADLTLRWRD